MNSQRKRALFPLLMILIVIGVCEGTSYAQFSVSVTGHNIHGSPITNGASIPAPHDPLSPTFNVRATVSGNSNSITKVVFYRNRVPYLTDTSSPYQIPQGDLGQENYTYHARAYDSTGAAVDSNDFKLTFYQPRFIRMGDDTHVDTSLPGRDVDHTKEIQAAVDWLYDNGGGTLFFPCTIPQDSPAIYNIKSTIYIPPNVTLQGESAEEGGPCRIYWNDVDFAPGGGCAKQGPSYLNNSAMFKIVGGTSRVRFRDLLLMSRTTGPWCNNRADFDVIAEENTAAIEMNTDDEKGSGDITDVIFENVSIDHFTRGIKAVSYNESGNEYEISGVKIRGYHPYGNTTALYIDARYAYNWDIQNFNPASIVRGQGAIEIVNAGRPPVPDGETTNIRFLQLNCNGQRLDPRPFCVKVKKHGGLYFRQLHHEGVDKAIIVENISSDPWPNNANFDPIVFESSVASGEFNDPSMKLYLIGNGIAAAPEIFQAELDDARMKFKGLGRDSTVVDCGDVHWDWTDVVDGNGANWPDYKMLFTHSERYRGSFFAETTGGSYIKPHTYCPSGVSGLPNIDEVGGEFFDNGVLPHEPDLYSNELNYVNCPPATCDVAYELDQLLNHNPGNGGSVYINGTFTLNNPVYLPVNIPRGRQIIGAPNAELILGASNKPLFKLFVKILTEDNQYRLSGIAIRNLKLSTTAANTTGIEFRGELDPDPPPPEEGGPRPGVSSDIHFSGLTLQGFTTGIYAAPHSTGQGNPMIDGISMKNMSFVNNTTAVLNTSSNSSNWNVMDLSVQSSVSDAVGWSQVTGGHQGLQDVSCSATGTLITMQDCIRVQMVGGFYLNRLKQTTKVTNALTVGESLWITQVPPYAARQFSTIVIRNSDLTSSTLQMGRMNVLGKSFITSMNNKYKHFNVESAAEGNLSRVTYCGDSYTGAGGTAYPGLDELHSNLWVGVPTSTRVQCGARPIPYDEAVRWTNNYLDNYVGTPLVGNFFDDTKEDFVVYRTAQSRFLIQQPGGPGRSDIQWGLAGDIPLVGNFLPNTRDQIVIWRPSTGDYWFYTPATSTYFAYHWGQTGDVPFIGNFFDESGPVSGNKDDVAVYRPGDSTFYISNPRSGVWFSVPASGPQDSKIQVADFLGNGHDQIAQYRLGVWRIVDPQGGATYTVNFGETLCAPLSVCDIPVAGKYLPQVPGKNPCAQVGVWNSGAQEFRVADPVFVTGPATNCGTRSTLSMNWGVNYGVGLHDIPLTIGTANGLLRRPTAYRRTKGAYDHGLGDGLWWVHDPF